MKQERKLKEKNNVSINKQKTKQQDISSKTSNQPKKTFYRNANIKKSMMPIIKINGQAKNQQNLRQNKVEQARQQKQKTKNYIKKEKTHKIAKKKINFQINYSNIQKHYKTFGNLFIHALKKLTCDSKFLQPQKKDPTCQNFPHAIVNILYGQNINNYNPYIETLDKLYEIFKGKISKEKMQRIIKLCHIGVAKNYFKSQKYTQTPKYRRVNILIRTYMYQNMRSIIQQKVDNYENIVFIPCTKGALNFQSKKFPEQLKEICSFDFYKAVIDNVNKIIEEQYIKYKKINTKQTVTDRWGQNFTYFLTFLFLVIFFFTNNVIFTYILAFMISLSLALFIYQSKETLSMLGSSKNIIQKIQDHVDKYLREINTHNMEWKVGQDFYWLEIHYIRKRKKKPPKLLQ